jgi:Family of unknown function (DUF7003)
MNAKSDEVLRVLDACCGSFAFPMLDNGYVYLAATRLSLFRSPEDWALVFEVFGFSPRERSPSTAIQTFASRLHDRDPPQKFRGREEYENYRRNHHHDEFRSIHPCGPIDWEDPDYGECVDAGVREIVLRGRPVQLPELEEYERCGIKLQDPERPHIFETCRYLAQRQRDDVLATPGERRISVLPEMTEILVLDEWNHPNVAANERPSGSGTFQQLSRVLETGDVGNYAPADAPNTHWSHWPDGGSL